MRTRLRKFTEAMEASKFTEVIEEIDSMIEKTIQESKSDKKLFIESFIKTPKEVKIEGLRNDSDINSFYKKYRNQIDACLSDIKFYDEVPSSSKIGAIGLNDYVIKGTMFAVKEFVMTLLEKQ